MEKLYGNLFTSMSLISNREGSTSTKPQPRKSLETDFSNTMEKDNNHSNCPILI